MTRQPHRPAPGFTLVEVLVALVICATTALFLYQQVHRSMLTVEQIEYKQLAVILAKNRLDELALEKGGVKTGENRDVIDAFGNAWTVESVITDSAVESLKHITVNVYHGDEYKSGTATLTLVRFMGEH